MTDDSDRPAHSRLAVRFAAVLALALLPIGVIAFIQTNSLEREVRARAEQGLLGATVRAADPETRVIVRVQGIVASLAQSVVAVIDDTAACSTMMKRIAAQETTIRVLAYVPASGIMTCSTTGRTHDFRNSAIAQRIDAARTPIFTVNPRGPLSGESILGLSHPVFDQDGTYMGYVGASIPHATLRALQDKTLITEVQSLPVMFWTFDGAGTVLTASTDIAVAERQVPANKPLAAILQHGGQVFDAMSRDGRPLTYAVVPIVPGELYLMSSWDYSTLTLLDQFTQSAYLPLLLMWLAGLVVAAFAAERLVTRHVRVLNTAMVAFANGDRRLRAINLEGAPVELHELAEAHGAMAESVTRSEAELEDSVHQKEVLLREVHHRVKNNLQLISSIMNIQIRNAKSGEARDLVKNLQERIMSLATVHRELYQTSGLADVKARELFPEIVRQIMALSSGSERPYDITLNIDDLRLVPDQAVPLSLLLAEALANAIKHGGSTRAVPGRLGVSLKRTGGNDAVLEVTNERSVTAQDPQATIDVDSGLGTQLITAFVQQVGGRKVITATETSYSLKVFFAISPLVQAENREDGTRA